MYKSRKISALFSVIVLLLSSFYKANAQNPSNYYVEEPRTFYGGFIVGANFCQVDGDSYAGYHKIGANLGAVVYARFAPKIAGSLEILYSQKGARSTFAKPSNDSFYTISKQNINLNYVEIPIQINYFDKRKSNFGVGFSFSQLISSKEDIKSTNPVPYDESKYPFKKTDFNFIASGQLHLTKGLYANLRFQYSIVPIRKDYDPMYGRAQQYNNMWTLRLMYLFD